MSAATSLRRVSARAKKLAELRAKYDAVPARPLAEQLYKLADQGLQAYALGGAVTGPLTLSERHTFLRRMAIARAFAALELAKETPGPYWREAARSALRVAKHERRCAARAAGEGR